MGRIASGLFLILVVTSVLASPLTPESSQDRVIHVQSCGDDASSGKNGRCTGPDEAKRTTHGGMLAAPNDGARSTVDLGPWEFNSLDCNGNGLIDAVEVADGVSADCDGNDLPDECDPDHDHDGIPDACQGYDGVDCNGNGVPDDQDIAMGTSQDCNGNGIPDECDTAIDFTDHPIETPAPGAYFAIPADLDGDGAPDVVVAQFETDQVLWHENTDGQGTFGPAQVVADAQDGVRYVHAADLDGDLDLDILAALHTGEKTVWFENLDGGGGFAPPFELPSSCAGSCPRREIRTADLDGDGDLDVVVAKQVDAATNAGQIEWHENLDGTGSFGLGHPVAFPRRARPVAIADVDQDHDPDIVVSSGFDSVHWAENAGVAENWPEHPIHTSGGETAAAADVDGDGDTDILTARYYLARWDENSSGTFTLGQIFGGSLYEPYLVVADIDADGDPDAFVSSKNNRVGWYENNGYGGFGPERPIGTPSSPTSVQVADLDGDGDLDVLVATSLSDKVRWYENRSDDCDGNGVPDTCQNDCDGNGIADACESDCNGNGDADVCDVTSGESADCDGNGVPDECEDCNGNGDADSCDIAGGSSIDCTGNGIPDECEPDCNQNGTADSCDVDSGASSDDDGNGIPDECQQASCSEIDFFPQLIVDSPYALSVEAADLDGDDDLDAVGGWVTPGRIQWFQNQGPGFVSRQELLAGPVVSWDVIAADVDGDDDLDVIATTAGDDTLGWFENDGDVFGPRQVISNVVTAARAASVADVDGDGDPDVVSAAAASGRITWHENSSAGASWSPHLIAEVVVPQGLFAADLDGDGDTDVVAADSGCSDPTIPDEGSGCCSVTFDFCNVHIACRDVVNGYDPYCFDVGWDEICAAEALAEPTCVSCCFNGPSQARVFWWENLNGLGTFGTATQLAVDFDSVTDLFVTDLDGDFDNDILAALHTGGGVVWYENTNGDGTFAAPVAIPGLANARSVFSRDLDGDGDRDVVSADGFKVKFVENLGNGSFAPSKIVPNSNHARAAIAADVDHNGDVDLVASRLVEGGLSLYENLQNDCDANCVPDALDPDCDDDGVPDACELSSGESIDCDGNGLPDDCQGSCPTCDADGDGCVDEADSDPGDGNVCADFDKDGCDDCSGGTFDPWADGLDTDGDGACDVGDCTPTDSTSWNGPGPARELEVSRQGSFVQLAWSLPEFPGATVVRYDVLRAPVASDFLTDAVCVVSDTEMTSAMDSGLVGSGQIHDFLVRVENTCPGPNGQNMGTDSRGVPRSGIPCP